MQASDSVGAVPSNLRRPSSCRWAGRWVGEDQVLVVPLADFQHPLAELSGLVLVERGDQDWLSSSCGGAGFIAPSDRAEYGVSLLVEKTSE
jgi:hypothetical protein